MYKDFSFESYSKNKGDKMAADKVDNLNEYNQNWKVPFFNSNYFSNCNVVFNNSNQGYTEESKKNGFSNTSCSSLSNNINNTINNTQDMSYTNSPYNHNARLTYNWWSFTHQHLQQQQQQQHQLQQHQLQQQQHFKPFQHHPYDVALSYETSTASSSPVNHPITFSHGLSSSLIFTFNPILLSLIFSGFICILIKILNVD